MTSVKITGDRELTIRFENMIQRTPATLSRILQRSILRVKRETQLNLSNRMLRRRSGKLASNWQIRYGNNGDMFSAFLETNTEYAHMLHDGGTIKPKGKYLAIPFPGVKGKPRDYTNTFFCRTKAGNLIIAQSSSGRRKASTGFDIKPLFLLKTSVRMPARPFLRRALEASIPIIYKIAEEEIRKLKR
jgi:hypothetical protein